MDTSILPFIGFRDGTGTAQQELIRRATVSGLWRAYLAGERDKPPRAPCPRELRSAYAAYQSGVRLR